VVKPQNSEQIVGVVKLANEMGTPVFPRGAGLSGGSPPVQGGIVLVLTDLDRLLEIDVSTQVAVVEPG